MTGSILRLSAEEVLAALQEIDPLELLSEELIGPTAATAGRRPAGRFVAEPAASASGDAARAGLTAVEDLHTGQICLFPVSSLQMIRSAGLAGLAARQLGAPGVVTAAVFGSGVVSQVQLAVIARHLPNLSHVAVYVADAEFEHIFKRDLLDQLELAGIGLSTTADMRQAAFGANVLILACLDMARLEIGQVAPGMLVVNATGDDLPDDLIDRVDQLYVDDLGLLEVSQRRQFIKLHLASAGRPAEPSLQHREGWHRHQAGWRDQRRIESDLGHVLTGKHPGRTHVDDTLLVELLSCDTVDVTLASRLQQSALKHGLGCWINSVAEE
jgi:ornithine cyclodeaminase/alanine dehydrogenase-like protein (mu-crystallin family)